jgi:signal transduction histidine kinase
VVQRLLPRDASRVHWQIDPALSHVPRPIAFACYRIAVEAVRNAITHGNSRAVIVTGTRDAGGLRLVIRDDGTGFDPNHVSPERFGIRTMQGRAQMVGGSLTIESSVGGSTCVQLNVPIVAAE